MIAGKTASDSGDPSLVTRILSSEFAIGHLIQEKSNPFAS
jgi:hypothetical protein